MNFIAGIVKSAGSEVSANDLMYSLIILDKSHGKIQEAILSPLRPPSPPPPPRLLPELSILREAKTWLCSPHYASGILPARTRKLHVQFVILSSRKRWYCIAYSGSECDLRASSVPGLVPGSRPPLFVPRSTESLWSVTASPLYRREPGVPTTM